MYMTDEQTSSTGKPKKCPICGITNEPSADNCDCGYDFAKSEMGVPRDERRDLPLEFHFKLFSILLPLVGLYMYFYYKPHYVRRSNESRQCFFYGLFIQFLICLVPKFIGMNT